MLHAEGLVRRYGDRTVLHGVDVHADAGNVVAILGPNGAGKTTLLSLLAGLQEPDDGSVGRPPTEIGWIPQHPAVYRRLTVRENLELFARLEGVADAVSGWSARRTRAVRTEGAATADRADRAPAVDRATAPAADGDRPVRPSRATGDERASRVDRMLDEAGLRDRADDLVGTLSGGGQQRVNIAVGLLSDPPVVLLDEPSSSLDPGQRERMWRFLTGLASEGRAVVFSTHDVAEAERYADTILVLVDGRIAYAGPPSVLAATADGDLLRAFVDLVERGSGDGAGTTDPDPGDSAARSRTDHREGPSDRSAGRPAAPNGDDE